MLSRLIVFVLTIGSASAACRASAPWSKCACGPLDFPQGTYQLVTGFFNPTTLKAVTDGIMSDVCAQKSVSAITRGVMGGMVTKISASQLLQMLALKDKMDKCLKSAGSSLNRVIDKASAGISSVMASRYQTMKAYGAQQAKGSNCKSAAVLNAMYNKACPMQTSSLVQSGITAVKGKMSAAEWSCIKSTGGAFVRVNLYKT
ncbi:hypothetical protein Q1695_002511 [Nippostrongylus brasiliensis]|nr:hypothetical protein Q1695_002511 [Nippostrongylus brasiliensis]